MNLANRLTMLRFILLPLFILSLAIEGLTANIVALVTFGSAAVTDLYDGWIARTRRIETTWGRFMDPLADKLLVISGLIFFLEKDIGIPAWMVVLIVVREFGITALRFVALLKGVVISASGEGKIKTMVQMVTIVSILILVALRESGLTVLPLLIQAGPTFLVFVTLVLTLVSGANYLWRHKELIFPAEE